MYGVSGEFEAASLERGERREIFYTAERWISHPSSSWMMDRIFLRCTRSRCSLFLFLLVAEMENLSIFLSSCFFFFSLGNEICAPCACTCIFGEDSSSHGGVLEKERLRGELSLSDRRANFQRKSLHTRSTCVRLYDIFIWMKAPAHMCVTLYGYRCFCPCMKTCVDR